MNVSLYTTGWGVSGGLNWERKGKESRNYIKSRFVGIEGLELDGGAQVVPIVYQIKRCIVRSTCLYFLKRRDRTKPYHSFFIPKPPSLVSLNYMK